MSDLEKKIAEELAKQSVEKLAGPVVLPLQAISEAIAGHVKSWRWVHQGRLLNRKSDAEIDEVVRETVKVVASKVATIPQERIQPPPLRLYGPTVEALGYAADEPAIRELFANLLASSMDSNRSSKAHPAFVEIIKQMNGDEARLLMHVSAVRYMPVVDLMKTSDPDANATVLIESRFHLGCEKASCVDTSDYRQMIDSLERLKLIEVEVAEFGRSIAGEGIYDETIAKLKQKHGISEEIKPIDLDITSPDFNKKRTFRIAQGFASMTGFGQNFVQVCSDGL